MARKKMMLPNMDEGAAMPKLPPAKRKAKKVKNFLKAGKKKGLQVAAEG